MVLNSARARALVCALLRALRQTVHGRHVVNIMFSRSNQLRFSRQLADGFLFILVLALVCAPELWFSYSF